MPNYVYSGFDVTGDPAEIVRFRNKMFRMADANETSMVEGGNGSDLILDFNAVIPMPSDVDNPEAWAVEHWGTKWNAFDLDLSEAAKDGSLHFQFTTAWDFPTPVFEALAAEFPSLVFAGSSYEEGHEFELVGEINGKDDWGPGAIAWSLWITADGSAQAASTVREGMVISIFDQPNVEQFYTTDKIEGEMVVMSVHAGAPTSHEVEAAEDVCTLSHVYASRNGGLTIIARQDMRSVLIHCLDEHLLIGVR